MKTLRPCLVAAALLLPVLPTRASVVINIGATDLQTNIAGVLLPAGSLIQLVNLGADGLFNQIDLGDGNTVGNAQWVSGDDTLITAPFSVPGGTADFPSAAAFDLEYNTGATPDSTPGFFSRAMEFTIANLPAGTKIGIRWFVGIQAVNFGSTTLTVGQRYGEFTRQVTPINGGDSAWVGPADGANVTLDPLITASQGGADPNSAGVASLAVVPEPSTLSFAAVALVGAVARRRRS